LIYFPYLDRILNARQPLKAFGGENEQYFVFFYMDYSEHEQRYFVFLLAGRRPAVAGLLGVLGASMSGPGLHPIRKAADAACSYASPKQHFTPSGDKCSLPRHLRIGLMAD
jgi:hypothetical protein